LALISRRSFSHMPGRSNAPNLASTSLFLQNPNARPLSFLYGRRTFISLSSILAFLPPPKIPDIVLHTSELYCLVSPPFRGPRTLHPFLLGPSPQPPHILKGEISPFQICLPWNTNFSFVPFAHTPRTPGLQPTLCLGLLPHHP